MTNETGLNLAAWNSDALPTAPDKISGFAEVRAWQGWEGPPLGIPPKGRWEVYAVSSPAFAPCKVKMEPRRGRNGHLKRAPN
jgi:hypothetical protein